MKTLLQLQQSLQSTRDLQTVVKAMKAMASADIYQYQQAVLSLEDYFETVEQGLQILLQSLTPPSDGVLGQTFFQTRILPALNQRKESADWRVGMVVFGSEQGMSGHFNKQIVTQVIEALQLDKQANVEAIIQPIGSRLPAVLESQLPGAVRVEPLVAMPGNLEGVEDKVETVALRINTWYEKRAVQQILLFHQRPEKNASYEPVRVELVPLDQQWLAKLTHRPWPSQQVPAYGLPSNEIFSELIRQFLFVSLYRAFVESLASENASRLMAMQVAEHKINDRLQQLQQTLNQQRQIQITEEVLNLAAGYEALK